MVRLTKIYTRSGDDGLTALADGTRRPKYDIRIAAYGAIDEANAAIGVARLSTQANAVLDDILMRLQNDLFDLGADLATPETETPEQPALRISAAQVKRLEGEIDKLNAPLDPLRSFILPGGTQAAAYLHVARTIMRRAERHISALIHEKKEAINPNALHFANRASDLLFVAARCANYSAKGDILWQAGKNR